MSGNRGGWQGPPSRSGAEAMLSDTDRAEELGGPVTILRHRAVVDVFDKTSNEFVIGSREKDDETDVPTVISFDRSLWEEMGKPEQVTITVQPGDRLNG